MDDEDFPPPVAPTHYRKRLKPGEYRPETLFRWKRHLSLYWQWRVPEFDGFCAKCRTREEYKREFDLGGEG
jgi:hypothetical protein